MSNVQSNVIGDREVTTKQAFVDWDEWILFIQRINLLVSHQGATKTDRTCLRTSRRDLVNLRQTLCMRLCGWLWFDQVRFKLTNRGAGFKPGVQGYAADLTFSTGTRRGGFSTPLKSTKVTLFTMIL